MSFEGRSLTSADISRLAEIRSVSSPRPRPRLPFLIRIFLFFLLKYGETGPSGRHRFRTPRCSSRRRSGERSCPLEACHARFGGCARGPVPLAPVRRPRPDSPSRGKRRKHPEAELVWRGFLALSANGTG